MTTTNQRHNSLKRNKLLRYKTVLETYLNHKTEDIPFTVVWRKYIYPKHFISKSTLYNIINTPVNKELSQVNEQLSLFDNSKPLEGNNH